MNATSALSRLSQLLVLALILMTGSHAFGQSPIVQTYTFSNVGPGNLVGNFNDFSYYQALDPGDTLVLTSVTLEFTQITSSGTAIIYNTSGYPVIGNPPGYPEILSGGFTNTFTGSTTVIGSSITGSVVVTSGTTSSGTAVAVGGSYNTGTVTGTMTPNPQDLTVSNTSSYVTTTDGTVTITVAASTSVAPKGDAGSNQAYVAGSAAATVSGTFSLIYNFTSTPVPEPSKTAAIFIGFAMCVLVGRNYLKGRGLRFS